ncbi:MAG: glycosyltransferase family 2 protein [Propionibacteriaceae bacterium]|nr:glycosyltransferase family 2 protein [Propionibacteriaceae bacterium]
MTPPTRSPEPARYLRRTLAGLQRRFDRRAAGAAGTPSVSVIVPFHNVEPYLAECIESILTQAGPTLELLLVDDGSTDASAAIAAAYARRDPRIILLSTPSLGPGGARNAGIRVARGKYLAFVDSDDRLATGALSTLVHALETDQVDVVMAAVARFNSTRSWTPRWVGEIHDRPRHRIAIRDFPAAIRNNYSWNKLYRRDYWLRQNLWFEDRVTFQDQPLVAQMLWRANSITVLDTVVYEYRDRDDRSSISQRTEEHTNLRDRAAAWRRTVAAIDAEDVPDPVSTAWYRTLLRTHFHWYLSSESIADPAYWRMLRDQYLDLARRFPAVSLDSIHARQRLPLILLEQDEPATLRQLVSEGGVGRLDSAPADGGSRLIPSAALREATPEMLFTPLPALLVEAVVVRGGWFTEHGELGCNLDVGFSSPDRFGPLAQIELEIRDLTGAVVLGTNAGTRLTDDEAGRPAGLQHPARIRVILPSALPAGSYQLWLTVSASGRRAQVPVTRLLTTGGAAEAGAAKLPGSAREVRLLPGPHGHAPVQFVIDRPAVSALAVTLSQDALRLELTVDDGLEGVEFRSSEGRVVVAPASGSGDGEVAVVETVLPRLQRAETGSWNVVAIDSRGRRRGIRWAEGLGAVGWPRGGDALVARATTKGNLKLDAFAHGVAVATSVTDGGVLTLSLLSTEGETRAVEDEFDLNDLASPAEWPATAVVGPSGIPMVAAPRLLAQLPAATTTGLTVVRARPRRLAVRQQAG